MNYHAVAIDKLGTQVAPGVVKKIDLGVFENTFYEMAVDMAHARLCAKGERPSDYVINVYKILS